MRTTICLFGLLAFSLGVQAQQTIVVTPQTLIGWTVTGADPQALSQQRVLGLPAGAQLARSFRTTALEIKVTAPPFVGTSADDWPVLEIGDAALLFARGGSTGNLLLVLGDKAPVELPFTFSLDAAGRSVVPLTVIFSRQGAAVHVGLADQTLEFSAGPAANSGLEVVASAGRADAWELQNLVVTVAAPLVSGSTDGQSADASRTEATPSNLLTQARPDSSGIDPLAKVTAPAGGPVAAGPASGASTRPATLEIFTPPAVRRGRADAIRAAGTQGKTP
jgi:hypothetical protein